MQPRELFSRGAPSLAAAILTPAAVFFAKPRLPTVTDEFQLEEGDLMTAQTLNRHIDVRASRIIVQQLAQLRQDGLI